MISHSPLIPLLPQMVQEAASECSDTMGSAHVRCSPPRWQGPYTDMMCLTKAAGEGRGGRQKKKTRKEERENWVNWKKNTFSNFHEINTKCEDWHCSFSVNTLIIHYIFFADKKHFVLCCLHFMSKSQSKKLSLLWLFLRYCFLWFTAFKIWEFVLSIIASSIKLHFFV